MGDFVLKTGGKATQSKISQTNNNTSTKEINADDGYVKTKWREERIWIEAIEKEGKAILEWNESWGFLADYDMKGELKVKEPLPEKISVYSDSVPASSGQTYGHRLNTETAKQMEIMQAALSSTYRRQKNPSLIHY